MLVKITVVFSFPRDDNLSMKPVPIYLICQLMRLQVQAL